MAGEKKTFSGKKREEFQGAGKKKETGKQEKPGQDRKKKKLLTEKLDRKSVV